MSYPANKPGELLPNLAMLLMVHEYERMSNPEGTTTHKQIVLAFTGPNANSPFVTWDRWVTHDKRNCQNVVADDTVSGHYFMDLRSALEDFDKRIEKVADRDASTNYGAY